MMPTDRSNPEPSTSFSIRFTFEASVSRERAWRALCEEIDAWWPRDMRSGAADSRMRFESTIGGRLREEWGNGGILWYTLVGIVPSVSLDLCGWITPQFGGPAFSCLRVELAGQGQTTKVTVIDGVQGRLGADMPEKVLEGWRLVFETAFKTYCETKDRGSS